MKSSTNTSRKEILWKISLWMDSFTLTFPPYQFAKYVWNQWREKIRTYAWVRGLDLVNFFHNQSPFKNASMPALELLSNHYSYSTKLHGTVIPWCLYRMFSSADNFRGPFLDGKVTFCKLNTITLASYSVQIRPKLCSRNTVLADMETYISYPYKEVHCCAWVANSWSYKTSLGNTVFGRCLLSPEFNKRPRSWDQDARNLWESVNERFPS